MKNFKFKWLLLSFALSVASVNQVWGHTISNNIRLTFFDGGDWGGVWIHIKHGNNQDLYYELTRIGSTRYYYWDVGSNGRTDITWFRFYKTGDENNNKTTDMGGDVTSSKLFMPKETWGDGVYWNTYYYVTPGGGATIYFDNTGFEYSKVYFRAGFEHFGSEAFSMTKVDGTDQLYKITLPNAYPYDVYTISDNCAWTGRYSIYTISHSDSYDITKSTPHANGNITGDMTFLYSGSNSTGDDGCQYYSYSTFSGHTRDVSITEPTGGTITVSYTDENDDEQTFTSGTTAVAQTCIIKANAVADRGYTYTSSTIDENTYTLNTDYIVRSNVTITAIFTPKNYTTVNLDNGSGTGSSTIGSTVTTGSAYPSVIPPVLNGSHFMGYYSATSGGGTKYYNEDGTPTEDAWFVDANTDVATPTLYAYYVTPTISSLTFTPSQILPSDEIVVIPNYSDNKTPEGTYSFCYVLTTGTGDKMQVQPTEWETYGDVPGEVKFIVPGTPGQYTVRVYLFAGSTPDCTNYTANLVASYTGTGYKFTVEAANAVTVSFKCGDVEVAPSRTIYATAISSATITAPDIAGLAFDDWTYDDEIIMATGTNPLTITATEATTLTANYTQGPLFFKNTKNWEHVYIYFYNSTSYWTENGSGSEGTGSTTKAEDSPFDGYFISGPHEMSVLAGTTDVYYYDGSIPGSAAAFAFTDIPMTNYKYFAGPEGGDLCNVVRRSSSINADKPMIVPVGDGDEWNQHRAKYYAHDEAPLLTNWGYNLRGFFNKWGTTGYEFKAAKMGDLSFTTIVYLDTVNYDFQWKVYNGTKGYGKTGGPRLTYNSPTSATLDNYDVSGYNLLVKTNYAGEHIFTLNYSTASTASTRAPHNPTGDLVSHMTVTVTYPVTIGTFRLVYTDGSTYFHPGKEIKKRANGLDTVSMYVASGNADKIKIQSCTSVANDASNAAITWGTPAAPSYATGVNFASILSAGGAGTYNFIIKQNAAGTAYEIIAVEKYTGNFYIRTDCVDGNTKWHFYKAKDSYIMHHSEYSTTLTTNPYSHYYTKWIAGESSSQTKIKFTVATDYSYAISDTLTGDAVLGGADPQVYKTNVRFMYNQETNALSRAYTQGPTDPLYLILRTPYVAEEGENHAWIYKSWTSNESYTRFASPISLDGVTVDTVKFKDLGNWVYQADVYARPNAPIKLTGHFGENTQYFKGTTGTAYALPPTEGADAEKLIGGTGNPQHMRIVYDFKTNRMITSWLPPETAISGDLHLDADILLLREHQGEADAITFETGDDNKLEDVKKVYGVMQFNKSTLNSLILSRYERNLYWISFPFNVNLSDVFGFGEYGTHWIIERYDGIGRAKNGFWADSPSNWKFITPYQRDSGWVLNANEGYILALDLDELGTESSVWDNSVSTGYLYFPSSTDIGTIKATSKTVNFTNQSEYKCNIGPRFDGGDDRRIKDSYWHCIGVPSFAGASQSISDAGIDYASIEHPEEWTANIPFVYRWNSTNNTLSVATGSSSMTFAAMYSYLVQYSASTLSWTSVTNTPSSVAARLAETPDREFCINLMHDSIEQDHTYVRFTDDASVSNRFEFNYDLSKEYNAGRGNIWTVTADTVQVAGNSQPHPLTTTIVPVGVKIAANGEYTFSMPEGTNGGDVWLIDNANSSRTNLGLMDYTVNLTTGTYEGRFSLEFPVQNVVTEIENAANANANANADVRKVFVGGRLYILRDGKAYDATGAQVR